MRLLSRRQALEIAGFTGVLAACGSVFSHIDKTEARLRPPGAPKYEEDFLKLCHKCQKCTIVCETGVIETVSLADSVRAASTPVLNFDKSWCNLCKKCFEQCPTGALIPNSDGSDMLMGMAKINKPNCIAWSWTGCTVCSEVCPLDAIYLDEKFRPYVDEGKCNGCGLCQLKCPNASIRSFSESSKIKGIVIEPLQKQ